MQNISLDPCLAPTVPTPTFPYPEGLDRVYYSNHTFTSTTDWSQTSAMAGLRYLYLYVSTFPVGTTYSALAPLGSIASLITLYLIRNVNLTGSLPASWSGLTALQRLYVDRNVGTSEVLPGSYSALTRLRYVYFRSLGWATPQVDSFLSQMATLAAAGLGSSYTSNKRIYLNNNGTANPNGAPTGGAANADIVLLNSLGWTVYHN